ncbi:MFS transporter [Sphingomonas sp. 37zxx]|uniref:MFS transporter n=1 Tax=Sphingomonas sp. 37zxx TaxID=1550073 RepID=UPI00053C0708|nr:MFS transporter [Sphingomonas sp. 37zxx]
MRHWIGRARRWAPSQHVRVYSTAHFGKSLLWNSSALVFAFFLTEAAGMRPATMGLVLGISLLFNACMDVVVGRMLAGRVTDVRAAARIQAIGAGFAAASFAAFAITGFISTDSRFAYALTTLLLFRLAYALCDTPQNAYMAFAAPDDSSRARFASARYVASGLSILSIAALTVPVLQAGTAVARSEIFLLTSLGAAIVAFASAMLLHNYAMRAVLPAHAATNPLKSPGVAPFADHRYPLLVGSIFIFSLTSPAFGKLEAYFSAFVLTDTFAASAFLASVALGKIMLQPAWVRLADATSLATTFRWAAAAWASASLVFLGIGPLGDYVALAGGFFYGAAWGGTAMAIWSLLARVAAGDPASATQRYGLFTFASKLAQSIAAFTIGHLLSQYDYRDHAADAAGLRYLMALPPFVGAIMLLAVPVLMRVRLRPSPAPDPRFRL